MLAELADEGLRVVKGELEALAEVFCAVREHIVGLLHAAQGHPHVLGHFGLEGLGCGVFGG